MEDVEEGVIEQDAAVKVEEPPPSAEPENEVFEAVSQPRLEETDQHRTRLTSLSFDSEASTTSFLTDKLTDDYFDLSTSPREIPPIRHYVSGSHASLYFKNQIKI